MEDTVNWKFQAKTDDDHEVAEFFMTSARNWINYIFFFLFLSKNITLFLLFCKLFNDNYLNVQKQKDEL